MQRGIPKLEQQPLLRVHRAHLRCRQAKRDVVEPLRAANKAAVLHARGLRLAQQS